MNSRMAGQDLLHQRGAGTRHAQDEDRPGGGIPGRAVAGEKRTVESLYQTVEMIPRSRDIVAQGTALQPVAIHDMVEGLVNHALFLIDPSKGKKQLNGIARGNIGFTDQSFHFSGIAFIVT